MTGRMGIGNRAVGGSGGGFSMFSKFLGVGSKDKNKDKGSSTGAQQTTSSSKLELGGSQVRVRSNSTNISRGRENAPVQFVSVLPVFFCLRTDE